MGKTGNYNNQKVSKGATGWLNVGRQAYKRVTGHGQIRKKNDDDNDDESHTHTTPNLS